MINKKNKGSSLEQQVRSIFIQLNNLESPQHLLLYMQNVSPTKNSSLILATPSGDVLNRFPLEKGDSPLGFLDNGNTFVIKTDISKNYRSFIEKISFLDLETGDLKRTFSFTGQHPSRVVLNPSKNNILYTKKLGSELLHADITTGTATTIQEKMDYEQIFLPLACVSPSGNYCMYRMANHEFGNEVFTYLADISDPSEPSVFIPAKLNGLRTSKFFGFLPDDRMVFGNCARGIFTYSPVTNETEEIGGFDSSGFILLSEKGVFFRKQHQSDSANTYFFDFETKESVNLDVKMQRPHSLSISPDNKYLSFVDQGDSLDSLHVFDLETGELSAHKGVVNGSYCWSPLGGHSFDSR